MANRSAAAGIRLTFADRLRYAAPPNSRAEFERRGVRVKEEISFQGGDGYLLFLTPAAATASIRQILAFAFDVSDETGNDPIYAAPDYSAEFFATVQQEFTNLVDDPDYAALLGLFGTNLLYRTGSRPVAREVEEWGRPSKIEHPSQLRAIPNNAILQQLGFMAITLYGIGRAVSKDPELFQAMRERSARFRPRRADGGGGARSHRPRRVARVREYAQSRDVAQWGGTRAASGAGQSVARAGARDRTARSA